MSSGLTEESAKFATIGIGCIMVNILCSAWRAFVTLFFCSSCYDLIKLGITSFVFYFISLIAVASAQVVMTLVSIPLMDKTGRRTLHLYGLGGMFIFSIFITISFLIKASRSFQRDDLIMRKSEFLSALWIANWEEILIAKWKLFLSDSKCCSQLFYCAINRASEWNDAIKRAEWHRSMYVLMLK